LASSAVTVNTIDGWDPPLHSRVGVNGASDEELELELEKLSDCELLELNELDELLELDELELLLLLVDSELLELERLMDSELLELLEQLLELEETAPQVVEITEEGAGEAPSKKSQKEPDGGVGVSCKRLS
jgi:hypothetical protein